MWNMVVVGGKGPEECLGEGHCGTRNQTYFPGRAMLWPNSVGKQEGDLHVLSVRFMGLRHLVTPPGVMNCTRHSEYSKEQRPGLQNMHR